ncbi:MAG: sulfatase-like hydrolase/transferase [Mycobacteriales bacterium]
MLGSGAAPDLVVVVFDTARADAFTPYGASADATPVFAALAGEGQAVPAAFTTANWTLPAHVSLFTGLLPRQAGLAQAPGGLPQGAQPAIRAFAHRSLPVVLAAAGYQTIGVSANTWVSEHTGFDRWFEQFDYVGSSRGGRSILGLTETASFLLEAVRAETDDGMSAAQARVEAALAAADPGRPLFLFVNLVECHSPYLPPRPYNDLGVFSRLTAALEARRHLSVTGIWRACAGDFQVSRATLARMRHLYDRAVRSMDDWLARLLGLLTAHRHDWRRWLIVTSDHGENFGENDLIGHAFSLDDRLLHVPLLLHGPGLPRLPDRPVSLAALPQFLGDALGLRGHPWQARLPADVVLAQQDGLAGMNHPRIVKAAADWGVGTSGAQRMTRTVTALRDDRIKLLTQPGLEEVYDLSADPLETHPVPPAQVQDAEVLDRLAALRAAAEHPAVRAVTTWEPRPSERTISVEKDTAELERTLRRLGYL